MIEEIKRELMNNEFFINSKGFNVDEVAKMIYECYQGVDVILELRKMKAWLIANPKRRKKNYKRFIVNWLNKHRRKYIDRGFTFRKEGFKDG